MLRLILGFAMPRIGVLEVVGVVFVVLLGLWLATIISGLLQ